MWHILLPFFCLVFFFQSKESANFRLEISSKWREKDVQKRLHNSMVPGYLILEPIRMLDDFCGAADEDVLY